MRTHKMWLGLGGFMLCLMSGWGCSSGPSSNGNLNDNLDPDNINDNTAGGGESLGAAAFQSQGCTACHTPTSNNFTSSSIDDIVETLLSEQEHPGGSFEEMNETDVEVLSDFIIDVSLGEEDLDFDAPADNNNDNQSDAATATQWFEQVWNDFDRHYAHFSAKQTDWDALRAEYAPHFTTDLTAEQFVQELVPLLAELQDLHIWLYDAAGQSVEVYSRPVEQNYPNRYPEGVERWGDYPLWHGWLEGDIAYFSIDSFETEQWDGLTTGQADDLYATYALASALIIDVRANNGGNETIAATLASHLTDSDYVYGYHRSKNDSTNHNDFGDWQEHRLQPAENQLLLKPTACLIGERNMSSAEWFVLMMHENPNGITLIGDATRGSSGSPQEFTIDDVASYWIPSWEAFRADQITPLEDVGIEPTAGYSIAPAASYDDNHDFVLEAAITLLAPE